MSSWIRQGREVCALFGSLICLAPPAEPYGAVWKRVAERRIAYIARQLEALGRIPADALDRAVVMYYVYVGHLQMTHVAPQIANGDAQRRPVKLVFDALAAGEI